MLVVFGFYDFILTQSDFKFVREKFSWNNLASVAWIEIFVIRYSNWMKCYSLKFTFSIAWSRWFGIFDLFVRTTFSSKNFIHQIIIHTFVGIAVAVTVGVVHLIFHGLTHIRALTFCVGSRNRNTLFGTQFNDKNEHLSFDD